MRSGLAVRRPLANGALASLLGCGVLMLAGCGSTGGGGGMTTPPSALGGATDVYVIARDQSGVHGSILDFAADSKGASSPKGVLNLPAAMEPLSVATDSTGQIYVGGITNLNYQILVYPAGSTGAATPSRTIVTGSTGQPNSFYPGALAVDATGNLLVTGLDPEVAIYSATASGAASPARTLAVNLAASPLGVAVDSAGRVFVASETYTAAGYTGTIDIFAAGATGLDTPTQEITTPNVLGGIAVDASGNVYATEITLAENTAGDLTGTTAQIVEYSTSGTSTPARTITLPSGGNPITIGAGLRIDTAGNLFVAVQTQSTTNANAVLATSILGYGPTAVAIQAPAVSFSSSSWTYPAEQIAVH